jgi:hypothetical protein
MPSWQFPVIADCPEKQLKVILIHDSFGRFLAPYFHEQFAQTIFVKHMNFEHAKALIERERPDLVVDQRVGRNLDQALLHDPELEQRMVKARFAELSGPATFFGQKRLLEEGANSGDVLSLTLPTRENARRPDLARLKLEMPEDAELSLCFRPTGEPLRRYHCQQRRVQQGVNEIFFRLYGRGGEGLLEIKQQPGLAPLSPQELEIRHLPEGSL